MGEKVTHFAWTDKGMVETVSGGMVAFSEYESDTSALRTALATEREAMEDAFDALGVAGVDEPLSLVEACRGAKARIAALEGAGDALDLLIEAHREGKLDVIVAVLNKESRARASR